MSCKISTGGVKASEMLIILQPFVGIGVPGIQMVASIVKHELCRKAKFVADVGREGILTVFIETPGVEGRGFPIGHVGWGRMDEQEDWLFQLSISLVFGKFALQSYPTPDKFLGMLASKKPREHNNALKSLRLSSIPRS